MSVAASQSEKPATRRGVPSPTLPPWFEKLLVPVILVVAALLPFAVDSGGVFMQNCIQALAYTVMALGLNIVVGYAGLLDLGYVAFFAIGAYSMGVLGSTTAGASGRRCP